MRALGLVLAAVVLAACASPPATVDVPPTAHNDEPALIGNGRVGLHRYANRGHCWFFRDDSPAARAHHRSRGDAPNLGSGSPALQPPPGTGAPTGTPSPPAPSVAVPTSVSTCPPGGTRYTS